MSSQKPGNYYYVYEKCGEFLPEFIELVNATLPSETRKRGDDIEYIDRVKRSLYSNDAMASHAILREAVGEMLNKLGLQASEVFLADRFEVDRRTEKRRRKGTVLAMRSPFSSGFGETISVQDYLKEEGLM